jgi:hypothetical protein
LDLRRTAIVGVVTAVVLLGTGTASAATPQQIYGDLADNGRLDGKYTRAEIERALDVPRILGSDVRRPSVRRPRPADGTEARISPVARGPVRAEEPRSLPFSPLDVALLIAGGGPLLLIGFALRRRFSAPAAARVARV